MRYIVIDGWFIGSNTYGAERYAVEILKELDNMISDDIFILLVRSTNIVDHVFKKIILRKYKTNNSFIKNIELSCMIYKLDAVHIDFFNRIAIGKHSIVTRHDMFSFSRQAGGAWYRRALSCVRAYQSAIFSSKIVTVSMFSKNEIERILHVDPDKIEIIYNGWQHMEHIIPEEAFLENNGIIRYQYYLFVGRLVKNKNLEWIFKVADKNPHCRFVISGTKTHEKFHKYRGIHENIVYLQRVNDSALAALYKFCKALLLPSKIEGFGIPPLEALYYSRPIIISNVGSLPEIYGDSAHYIDPYKYGYDLDKILEQKTGDYRKILEKYSWYESAKQWYKLIKTV